MIETILWAVMISSAVTAISAYLARRHVNKMIGETLDLCQQRMDTLSERISLENKRCLDLKDRLFPQESMPQGGP